MGLGVLGDAVSVLVTEERNGQFELKMEYPVDGLIYDELKNDRLIKADAGHYLKNQRFKIIRITKPLKGIVTVYGEHVSGLTADLSLRPNVTYNGNAQQALNAWSNGIVDNHPFIVSSDISTNGRGEWSIKDVKNARQALGGVDGSLLDTFGGEYLFDNYQIRLMAQRGVNSGALIAYGRNLTDLTQEESIADTYTSVYPYAVYQDDDNNEVLLTLPEYFIDSQYVGNYARRKILTVDFSEEDITTVAQLRSRAQSYMTANNVGVPDVNLKVEYIDLAKTLDYKDMQILEEINVCDTVSVYFEKFGINQNAKIIKTVWDDILKRYDSIEIGNARASLSDSINATVDGKVERVARRLNTIQLQADGMKLIYRQATEPPAGTHVGDLWYQPDGVYENMYQWDGAIWKLVVSTRDISVIAEKVNGAIAQANEDRAAAVAGQQQAEANAKAYADELSAQWELDFAAEYTAINQNITETYNAAVADAEAYTNAQIESFDADFAAIQDSVADLGVKADDAVTASNEAITAAGFANDLATAASNLATTANNAAASARDNALTAIGDARTALDAFEKISVGGKNSVRTDFSDWETGHYSQNTGKKETWPSRIRLKELIPIQNDVYYFDTFFPADGTENYQLVIRLYDSNKTFIHSFGPRANKSTLHITTGSYIGVFIYNAANDNTPTYQTYLDHFAAGNIRPMIQLSSVSDKSFEPYYYNNMEQVQVLITDINGQLETKVSQQSFNNLEGIVSTVSTVAYQNQHDIGLKADSSRVDLISGTVEQHTSQINTNAQAISARLTESQINTLLNGKAYVNQTELTATAGGLNLAITQVQQNLDGLQIGGQNELLNSDFSSALNPVMWAFRNGVLVSRLAEANARYSNNNVICIEFPSSGDPTGGGTLPDTYLQVGTFYNKKLENGQKITLSFYAKSVNSGTLRLRTGGNWQIVGGHTTTGKPTSASYQKYVYTYEIASHAAGINCGFVFWMNRNDALYISDIQWELGEKATPWSLAPSELATVTKVTAIEANVEGIRTTVTNNTGAITTVQQQVTGIQSTVANKAEQTDVTQLAGQYTVLSKNAIQNLVSNSTFDSGINGWVLGANLTGWWENGYLRVNSPSYDGTTNNAFRFYTALTLKNGSSYYVSFKARGLEAHTQEITVGQSTASSWVTKKFTLTGEWETYSFIYDTRNTFTLSFYLHNSGAYEFDDFVVYESGGASEGQLTVLNNTINLRVNDLASNIVNQINISTEGILIAGNKVRITGQTTIDTAVIKSAMVDTLNASKVTGTEAEFATVRSRVLITNAVTATALQVDNALIDKFTANTGVLDRLFANTAYITKLNTKTLDAITANITTIRSQVLIANSVTSTHISATNALIDKLFATSALINQLTSKTAFISSVKAIDIAADKITGGEFNGALMNVININVSSLVGNRTNFVTSWWNDMSSSVNITSEGLISNASNGAQSILQNGVLLTRGSDGITQGYIGYSQNADEQAFSITLANGRNFKWYHTETNGSKRSLFELYPGSNETYLRTQTTRIVDLVTSGTLNVSAAGQISGINLSGSRIGFSNGGYIESQSASSNLQIVASNQLRLNSNGSVALYFDSGYGYMTRHLSMEGRNITNQSDERLKMNIIPDEIDSLTEIKKWTIAGFNWNGIDPSKPQDRQFGIIAQSASEIAFEGPDGWLNINSSMQLTMTTHAVQQLSKEMENVLSIANRAQDTAYLALSETDLLKQRVKELEEKIELLEAA